MITLYVTHDNRLTMGDEIFAPTGILERNKEEFDEQTSDTFFVVDDYVYALFSRKNYTKYNDRMLIVSEKLFREHKRPMDHDWDVYIENIPIVAGYLDAIPKAMKKNREITVLCGPDIMQQAVRTAKNIDRLLRVRVNTEDTIGKGFPDITPHFKVAYKKLWPKDRNNKYDAVLEVYLKQ